MGPRRSQAWPSIEHSCTQLYTGLYSSTVQYWCTVQAHIAVLTALLYSILYSSAGHSQDPVRDPFDRRYVWEWLPVLYGAVLQCCIVLYSSTVQQYCTVLYSSAVQYCTAALYIALYSSTVQYSTIALYSSTVQQHCTRARAHARVRAREGALYSSAYTCLLYTSPSPRDS